MKKTLQTYKYFILSIFFFSSLSNNFIEASEGDDKALKISTDAYNYDKGFNDFISNQTMTLRPVPIQPFLCLSGNSVL